MGRLTEKDEQGNWCVKGLPWKELYEGHRITKEMQERLYGCLYKLMEYEETGLTPDQVEDMQDRDACVPEDMEVIMGIRMSRCTCGDLIAGEQAFCRSCGKRLIWRQEEQNGT